VLERPLEPLGGLARLLLVPPARRDVAHGADGDALSLPVEVRTHERANPTVAAIGATQSVVHLEGATGREPLPERLRHSRRILRMHEVARIPADQLRRRSAEHPLAGRRNVCIAAVGVMVGENVTAVLDHRVDLALGLSQRGLSYPLGGDVA